MNDKLKRDIRVLIVEDQELVRVGLKVVLDKTRGIGICGLARDGKEAIEQVKRLDPDVIVMDIGLPFLNGIEATREIKRENPEKKVVMLTSHNDDDHVFAALGAGAEGYCLKESSQQLLVNAIMAVSQGAAWLDPGIARLVLSTSLKTQPVPTARRNEEADPGKITNLLTRREMEVLELVVDGKTNQDIADGLFISIETVKTHMRHIMEKLKVSDRTQAAVKAMKEGLF